MYNILTKHSAKKLQVITNPKTAQPHTILTKNKASLGKKIIIINLNTVDPLQVYQEYIFLPN